MAAWDITSYAYSGTSLDVSGFSGSASDLFFKTDGLKLYVLDRTSDAVGEYDLGTAWDISTATFTDSFSVASQEAFPIGMFIGSAGSKLYVVGIVSGSVHEYDLSTAWDVSTSTFNQSFSVSSQETEPTGLSFSDNGLRMFVVGAIGDDVNEYALSTAWDISTATFTDSFSVASQSAGPTDVTFGDSGSEMYVSDSASAEVYQYTLSTAFDVSTATYTGSLDVSSQSTSPFGVSFRGNGENLFIIDSRDVVYQYRLPVAVTSAATMAGTSTFTPFPSNIITVATMAGTSALSGAGASATATSGRAVDEASAGGTSAALSVSLNSAITEPTNPTRNT